MTQPVISRAFPNISGGFVAQRIGFGPMDKGKMGRSQYLLSLASEGCTHIHSLNYHDSLLN